jgi:hypothetical protein
MIVGLTSKYRELVPDLSNPKIWAGFKAHTAERRQALKISDLCACLYDDDKCFSDLLFQYSFLDEMRQEFIKVAQEVGLAGVVTQQVESADPDQLRTLLEMFLEFTQNLTQEIDEVFTDGDTHESESTDYWKHVHPTLPPEEQRQAEKDMQLFATQFYFIVYNALSVMAYGESLTSLVQRALAGGDGADAAMCKAVRVDNNLRQHPKFMARYLFAANNSETGFLNKYNNTATPLTYKIRYPGLYYLFALLDNFGLLDQLSNPQLLDLCDHARLDKWENRIEDDGYLAKRRSEYLKRKFIQMSRHSN